jgi:DNA primase
VSDLQTIKQRILNEDRVEELLGHMGCENVKQERSDLYVAQLPSEFKSDNHRSVQVNLNDSLTSHIRSRGVKGDIFSLVSYIVNSIPANEVQSDLNNAKQWIIEVLGYFDIVDGRYEAEKSSKKKHNSWLKEIKKQRKKVNWEDVKPNTPIEEKVKNQYVMTPWYDWIQEGISWETQKEFEVGYDLWTDRVVTMIRNRNGDLIGVKGRYVGDNESILDDKKYLYLHRMNKSVELFNLHRALPYILKHKSVLVWEGYKSVMKCYEHGIYNAVSIEGDDISPVQASLLKELGIKIDIILCFDKDKMVIPEPKEGEEKAEYPPAIMEQTGFLNNRNVYALIDKWNVLKDKDSPIDRGLKVFKGLFKRRFKLPIDNIFK